MRGVTDLAAGADRSCDLRDARWFWARHDGSIGVTAGASLPGRSGRPDPAAGHSEAQR
jgi:hypothetical protein